MRVPPKKELILSFFKPHIVPKKVQVPKKSMSSGKKGTHTFTGLTLHQKIIGFQKKELIVFRANILPKKKVPKQKYEFQKKKELILFQAQHSAIKSIWVPKKV